MFDRLFRRGASTSALCVNQPDDDATERLHDAERRIAQLELLLQQSVVELDSYRALAANPAKVVTTKKLTTVKPAKLSALEFWRLHGEAVDAIRTIYGDGWKVAAPFGETALVEVAAGYRRAKTERGTVLKWSQDQRVPSARFWPGGVYPDGVTVNGDYARDLQPARDAYQTLRARVAWEIRERHAHTGSRRDLVDYRARELLAKLRATPKPAPAPVRDAAWHEAQGYALHNGVWIAEILLRSQLAHEDAILAEREANRSQALERACLTYGPQPAVPFADIADDVQLAEAAD